MSSQNVRRSTYVLGLLVWFSAALFYFYQYILRVSPMVMVDFIRLDFNLDAGDFGSLMAITTFFYAASQIPIGVLSDLFSARRTVLFSLVACIGGVGLFGYTDNLFLAYVGRALIGLGSAAAFISVSKISSDWFPIRQKSFWFAATVIMGTAGAVIGSKQLAESVTLHGWREILGYLTWLGVGVLIINFIFIKDKPYPDSSANFAPDTPASTALSIKARQHLWHQIREVFFSRICWLYALVAMGMYLSISVFSDLWGVPFLQQKYGLTREIAAHQISFSYYGSCIGVLIAAFASRYFGNTRYIIAGSALMISLSLCGLVFAQGISSSTVSVLVFIIGFFAGAEILCFSEACSHMDVRVAATVTGFLNFIITLGGAIVQKLLGSALDFFWSGEISVTGARIYNVFDYQNAFILVLLISCFSSILSLFLPKDI